MPRTGDAYLPLHDGKAPPWLFQRMVLLSEKICSIICEEYGTDELLRRLANPYWFQAFSCVLGYDWHSSGTTTVTVGALKEAFKKGKLNVGVFGGKGRVSRKVAEEIEMYSKRCKDIDASMMISTSKMCAKVDSALVQDGYNLYHHAIIVSPTNKWAVIQQGMDTYRGVARRYHWLSEKVESFVVEPHEGIVGVEVKKYGEVLDLTSKKSVSVQKITLDIVKEGIEKVKSYVRDVRNPTQSTLLDFTEEYKNIEKKILIMPRTVNWNALKDAYEFQPKNYEEFVSIPGIGPSTVRALALISEIIFGENACWKDPVKYSFAVGGKDGVPFPVERKTMDEGIKILENAIQEAKMDKREKIHAIKRLKMIIPRK